MQCHYFASPQTYTSPHPLSHCAKLPYFNGHKIASSPMDIHVTLTFDFEEGGRITLDPQCPVGASTNAS